MNTLRQLHGSQLQIEQKRSGGNLVLSGGVGVGKTTLLRATAIIGALLLDVLVILWDYERASGLLDIANHPSPGAILELILQSSWDQDIPIAEIFSSWDQQCFLPWDWEAISRVKQKFPYAKGICFLVDEVNKLYSSHEPVREVGRTFMNSFLNMGKQNLVQVVMTGSSVRLGEQLFCSVDSEWGVLGYPNMNNSVFVLRRLFPIRDLGILKAYVRTRFRLQEVSDMVLAETGGVGRRVENFILLGQHFHGTELQEAIEKYRGAKILASAFLVQCGTFLDQGKLRDDKLGDIPKITNHCGDFDAQVLNVLQDEGHILMRNSYIELLVPRALELMHLTLNNDQESSMILGLRVTVRGWQGKGFAGAAAESLVVREFISELDIASAEFDTIQMKKSKDDQKEYFMNGSKVPLTFLELRQKQKMLLRFAADNGTDCFFFNWPDDEGADSQVVHVVLIQIKLGAKNSEIYLGDLSKQLESLQNKRFLDNTLAGIIVKLERSFQTAQKMVISLAPQMQCLCGGAFLLTNKKVERKWKPRQGVLGGQVLQVFEFDKRFEKYCL
eukprot:c32657_g1_i1.p1 GENE.c32657_g1_i1~~c32657_g1_i1.p1  ORF type:complete len:639 (-),score=134.74 c32657_g1_i1:13-1683(-)